VSVYFHVSGWATRILGKLGFTARAQIAAWVTERRVLAHAETPAKAADPSESSRKSSALVLSDSCLQLTS
jgi:hypothetical protein